MSQPTRLQFASERLQFACDYTNRLLTDLPEGDWFRMPTDGVTHIAWQVGHLAMAQFALCIGRLRTEADDDERLIAAEFRRHFGKGSTPEPAPEKNPPVAEIHAVFDRVHTRVMTELPHYQPVDLETPALKSHPLFTKKIDSLIWSAEHELIHAGQIALLRRLLGKPPLW